MILEIQFINQGKKAFGLTGASSGKQASGGAVSTTNAQNQNAAPLPQAVQDQLDFLKNQNNQLQQQVNQQSQNQGNGQAPPRQKPSTANMGHSSNGMNGQNLNHQNNP
jgi:hypothetical protein